MKTKENIHITLSRNLLKKIDENGNNKSEIIEKILSKYFSDLKKSDEISELKNELSELKNQMKRIDFFAKTSTNAGRFILQSIAKNDKEAADNYNEILEMIKNFKNSNS
jgi:metal-responsive CopG/Arc/MetJ family transcriptional regulator